MCTGLWSSHTHLSTRVPLPFCFTIPAANSQPNCFPSSPLSQPLLQLHLRSISHAAHCSVRTKSTRTHNTRVLAVSSVPTSSVVHSHPVSSSSVVRRPSFVVRRSLFVVRRRPSSLCRRSSLRCHFLLFFLRGLRWSLVVGHNTALENTEIYSTWFTQVQHQSATSTPYNVAHHVFSTISTHMFPVVGISHYLTDPVV